MGILRMNPINNSVPLSVFNQVKLGLAPKFSMKQLIYNSFFQLDFPAKKRSRGFGCNQESDRSIIKTVKA